MTNEPTETLSQTIRRQATHAAHDTYLEDARSERVITYRDLGEALEGWATTSAAPVEDVGSVAVIVSDPLIFAASFVSLIASGHTVVPLDPKAPVDENRRLMSKVGVDTVVSDENLDWPDTVIRADLKGPVEKGTNLREQSAPVHGAAMLFSSGSTGERKAIRLDETHLLRAADLIAEHHRLAPGERGYNSLPLHHINAEVVGLLATGRAGATLVLDGSFHRTGFWQLMADRRITWINAVPAIIAILASDPGAQRCQLPIRFVRSASSPLSVAVRERFEARIGLGILETFGMTEAASQITANPLDGERRLGSVGKPVGVELKVFDDQGNECAPGQDGHVKIRGASVVTSYVDNAASERFTADHWLDSGDLGHVDEDGYVFLVGRTDDVINRSGEKIFPREVEEVLMREADVKEVLVVGRPDDIAGRVPVAFVAVEGKMPTIVERLTKLCEQSLPRYMRPAEIVLLDALPRGVTGKLSRTKAAALATKT